MKTLEQSVQNALTMLREPLTKPQFARNLKWQTHVDGWAARFKFNTADDQQLREMVFAASQLIDDIQLNHPPRWLSFLGTSGIGKTHIARAMKPHIERLIRKQRHEFARVDVEFHRWPGVVDQIRGGDYELVQYLIDLDGLILDDIGAEAATPNVLEKLLRIMDCRIGKWTVLTSNLGMDNLHAIDPRMTSRLRRSGNEYMQINTLDYSDRQTTKPEDIRRVGQ